MQAADGLNILTGGTLDTSATNALYQNQTFTNGTGITLQVSNYGPDLPTKFKASVYVLKKDEGGRHTPFFNGYRPQFYFRTTDVTGVATLPSGTEMVMPGDNVELEVELITPIAMDKELRFAIREGGHTVGAGVVTEIVE